MKKWNFAHLCAYLSLAISITTLVLWCCNVGGFTVVSLDSFVGIIVALLAIITTLAIGWQIFNAIEIKNRIEKLDALEEKYREHDKKMYQIHHHSQHLIYASMGDFALETKQYLLAFHYYMKSLAHSMSLKTPSNSESLFGRMSITNNNIQSGAVWEFLEDVRDSDKKIRSSKNYILIKQRYESLYDSFISKVKEAE